MSDFEKCLEEVLGLLGAARLAPEEQLDIYEGWCGSLSAQEIVVALQIRRRKKALALELSSTGVIHDQEIIGRAIELLATLNPVQAVEQACRDVKVERDKKAEQEKSKVVERINKRHAVTRDQNLDSRKDPKNQ